MKMTLHFASQASDIALNGEFTTNQGRTITVTGQSNSQPIRHTTDRNPFATNTICTCGNCCQRQRDGGYSFSLHTPVVERCFETFRKSPQITVATLVEILTIALSSVRADFLDRSVLRLVGGVNDLVIPDDMAAIFSNGARLEIKLDPQAKRTGKSGLEIRPFTYKFPHQRTPGSGIVASTNSEQITQKHLGE